MAAKRDGKRRAAWLSLRLTPAEKELVELRARAENQNASELVRSALAVYMTTQPTRGAFGIPAEALQN